MARKNNYDWRAFTDSEIISIWSIAECLPGEQATCNAAHHELILRESARQRKEYYGKGIYDRAYIKTGRDAPENRE